MAVSENKKNVFISSFQIIIFQINIMESTSRSWSSPKRQKDVVMKSRSRSPMNVDTQNAKLKNATKKISLSNIKKWQNQVTMNPLKEKEIEIVQNQIMKNFQYERTKNLWSQYFRDGKTESDLIKERPPFILKRKLSIIFWKDSERKEHT